MASVEAAVTAGATLLGVALIGVGLRDIWHTLFHPSARGMVNRLVSRLVWAASRRLVRDGSQLNVAGPLAMTAVIMTWGVLLVLGWALLYWRRLPSAFLLATGLEPAEQGGFTDAVYLSLVTLGTLGYGDITPMTGWLRIVGPLQAFVGFSFFTAVVSWVLSVYPVLSRRRALGHHMTLLAEPSGEGRASPLEGEPVAVANVVARLVDQLIVVRGDLVQFPVTYYFRDSDTRVALPPAVAQLGRLADEGSRHGSPAVRAESARLATALEDLLTVVNSEFLHLEDAGREPRTRALLEDHGFPSVDAASMGAA